MGSDILSITIETKHSFHSIFCKKMKQYYVLNKKEILSYVSVTKDGVRIGNWILTTYRL
jgi:hypothetical protein